MINDWYIQLLFEEELRTNNLGSRIYITSRLTDQRVYEPETTSLMVKKG